jgi:hypothetical protein
LIGEISRQACQSAVFLTHPTRTKNEPALRACETFNVEKIPHREVKPANK